MKNNYLFVNLGVVLAIGIIFLLPSNTKDGRKYNPRNTEEKLSYSAQGAREYLTRIRANQNTKTISVDDVLKAQNQLKAKSALKAGDGSWKFRGPDNIGGRTRALLIDKDNSSVMYAGGVAGGLWKTTTAAQYWEPVEYGGATIEDFANLAISSICQAANGDIYFGTGEGLYYIAGNGAGGILGAGIWKSSDNGQTFERLESTWNDSDYITYSLVYELAADPSDQNIVYAATRKGLKITKDGGATWENAPMPNSTYDNQTATDVAISSDGTVIASVGNKCLVKKAGMSTFEDRSGQDSDNGGTMITSGDVGRMEFAFSPSDPNYVYCIVAKQDESLNNIYKSVDGGMNWVIVGKGGSPLFQPFGHQGIYDMTVAVNPLNKEEVFVGGLDIWVGKKAPSGDLFAWSQVTGWHLWALDPLYVHADQHVIMFDPKDPQIMFVASDGGISRGFLNKDGIKYQFLAMNKNYNVTQFYSVAANSKGYVMGGTQDNGTILIPNYGSTNENGYKITGGDGGHAAMSNINPNIAFATIYYGGLWRNNVPEYADWNTFYTSDFADYQNWSSGNFESDAEEAAFVTPIAYWETYNDPYSTDTIEFVAKKDYSAGETVLFYSHNIYKAEIYVTLDKDYFEGDTIKYHDPYAALFAIGMKRNLWLTRSAANWNKTMAQKDWWRAIKKGTLTDVFDGGSTYDEYITQIAFSTDGNHLFFSTSEEELYRLSNLNNARTYDEADYLFGKNIITELTKIGGFGNRVITGIACDPNNPNNLMVTLGNYGNNSYIYLCTQATYAEESSSFSNFIDITGDLPKVPTYCALFEQENEGDRAMIGTDMGVFMTENLFSQVSATNIEWTPFQEGVGPTPVFQITQNTTTGNFDGGNNGAIYIGTHGRGFFENRDYLGIEDDNKPTIGVNNGDLRINTYPNPVVSDLNIDIVLDNDNNVSVEVVNLNGQIIRRFDEGFKYAGEHKIVLTLDGLVEGAYIVSVKSGDKIGSQRIVKK